MQSPPAGYFTTLNEAIGSGWNRFWFTPARATTLGVIRILLGIVSFYAIASYGPDLQVWLAPDGMLPREIVRELYPVQWSVFNYVQDGWILMVHSATLVVLALLVLGVGGRVVAILSTVMVLSYFNRVPVVTGEAEPVLAFLLVYLCIGRSTDAASLAAVWRKRRGAAPTPAPTATNAISLRLMQVHLAIVHLMMGLAQLSAADAVWWSGEGIWLAAARPDMALLDFHWLAENHKLAAAWSHAVVVYLLAFPVFIWSTLARPLVLALGVLVWCSLALATGWILFCAAMLTGTIAFVDSAWLESLPSRTRRRWRIGQLSEMRLGSGNRA